MWNEGKKELQINDIITATTTIKIIIIELNNKNWFAESGAPIYPFIYSNDCVVACVGLEH